MTEKSLDEQAVFFLTKTAKYTMPYLNQNDREKLR